MKRVIAYPVMAAMLLAGCASVPKAGPQVSQVQDTAIGLSNRTAAIDADWWTAFGDPQLDRLIETGLAGNPSLAMALARVRAAQAGIENERAGLLPHIKGSAQLDRGRIGDKFLPEPIGGSDVNIGIAVTNFSWDLDLFG